MHPIRDFRLLARNAYWTAGFVGAFGIIGLALPFVAFSLYSDAHQLRVHGVVTTATDVHESVAGRDGWDLDLQFTLADARRAECTISEHEFTKQPRPVLGGTTQIRYDTTDPTGLCAPASTATSYAAAGGAFAVGALFVVSGALVYARRGRRIIRSALAAGETP